MACNMGGVSQMLLQRVQQWLGVGDRLRNQIQITQLGAGTHELPKGVASSRVEGGLLLVHPALGLELRL